MTFLTLLKMKFRYGIFQLAQEVFAITVMVSGAASLGGGEAVLIVLGAVAFIYCLANNLRTDIARAARWMPEHG